MQIKLTKLLSYTLAGILSVTLIACGGGQSNENTDTTDSTEQSSQEDSTAAEEKSAEPIASPRKQATGTIDGVSTVIDYGSPAVKGRTIWGGLEDYDVVWRAGANETTSVEFAEDVVIGGSAVAAGKYGIYMIPREGQDWVFILNTDWDREQHGAWGAYNYNEKNDVLRLEVAPEWVEEVQERLEYSIEDQGIGFAWEKVRFVIPVNKAAE